ncbi:YgjP-like metallopeptidase domain-containing protein [Mesomycoplasma hyopneumoniae]|uniref:YgjP-like metallopeptidase domain-containing protein n=1 Tax=Mesomycoplasma hyopneumoniae TaxID=2099 RepID=UPI0015C5D7AD|nr:YgjP-like metallopeptidase domain-containing protein [Mesomycoplasma hyopneumoniae]QLG43713.1 M48 family metallopeptidase [Mesomycoplasma hyopneumoniae]
MKTRYKKLVLEFQGKFYTIFLDYSPKFSKIIIKMVDDFILVRSNPAVKLEELIKIVKDSNFFQKVVKILPKRVILNFSESSFYLFGKKYYYNLVKTQNKLFLQAENLVFSLTRARNLEAKIQKVLMNFFLNYLKKRTNYWAQILEIPNYEIKIARKNAAWGTNYRRKKIHYSYFLLPFSKKIIDYVIVHELVHHFFSKHNKLFWEKVAEIIPNYKELIRKLNDYELN